MSVSTLIFAGGVGKRMTGSSRPKQFLEIGGRPIIDLTIEKFATHPEVDDIVIVCLKDWIPYLEDILVQRSYGCDIEVIPGGSTGQDSRLRGLERLHEKHADDPDAIVLIHDGVRPLIDAKTISSCIDSTRRLGPTATVAPATETIIVSDDTGKVSRVLNRSECGLARAPQGFALQAIYDAYRRSDELGLPEFVDSISMMSHFGSEIHTVEGPVDNIKVTTPLDFYALRAFIDARDQQLLWKDDSDAR